MTDEAKVKKDVVPSQYRDKYKTTGGTCGDFIAEGLSKVAKDGVEALGTVKAENGIPAAKWAGMNPGMQRMNLANTLRATYLRGETVKILGREYNARHQAEDFNGEITNDKTVLTRLAGVLDLQQNDRTVDALSKLFFPPENKSVIAKAKREEEREAKRAAKEAEKAEKAKARDEAKAAKEAEKAEKAKQKEAEKAEKAEKAAAEKQRKVDEKATAAAAKEA